MENKGNRIFSEAQFINSENHRKILHEKILKASKKHCCPSL